MEKKLLKLLSCESLEINLSFEKASIEGEGTPQEVADRRESALVNAFIAKYFPFPYRIIKGNIIDSYNNRSNSIDCIVLSPSHPYTIDPKNEKASIIFADGVDFAIEVKPDLVSKTEIFRSLNQVRSVKRLKRKRNGLLSVSNKVTKEELEISYQIPTFIFANKTYSDLRLLIEYIIEYNATEKVPLNEQFDFIVINNRTIIFNSNGSTYAQFSGKGILFSETNENTLATFLLWLNRLPKSEATVGPNVLEFYLNEDIYLKNMKTYHDLNLRIFQ